MMETDTLVVFTGAALLLLVTPGPAVLYVVARSLEQGRLAGLVSAVGLGAGSLVHIVAAAFGVSALLASSLLAFELLRYAGAAYLIWLGLTRLLGRGSASTPGSDEAASLKRAFGQGVFVSVSNPKAALFLFAFLPQFADPARGSVAGQILLLGGVFLALALLSDGLYVLAAGGLRRVWIRRPGFARGGRYLSGSVYLGLGLATALAGPRK